jgi:site-specific DNA-methyltransferase (adenine-specific)
MPNNKTHPRGVPSQGQLALPLLALLRDHEKPLRARDAVAELGKTMKVPEQRLAETVQTADGQTVNVWGRHVRFAKLKAASMGFLAGAGHGLWQITDEGRESLKLARTTVRVHLIAPGPGAAPGGAIVEVDVGMPTVHALVHGDARDLSWIPAEEIGLAVSSIPYFDLKTYSDDPGQLAAAGSYEEFLAELDQVLREVHRVLVPGGRFACNVGDVLRSRKRHGTHQVLPLHADVLTRGRAIGFHALTGIEWRKVGNKNYEQGPGGMLGKPGQKERMAWFRGTWSDVPGARATKAHPAPFPVEIPYRLVRMFSFAGDVVLDPFAGSFTTSEAAAKAGRNSVGVEIARPFVDVGINRLQGLAA